MYLAEQVNPYTNEPISVSPLTWSHATVVSTSIKYLEKLEQLAALRRAAISRFSDLRRPEPVEVKSHATFRSSWKLNFEINAPTS